MEVGYIRAKEVIFPPLDLSSHVDGFFKLKFVLILPHFLCQVAECAGVILKILNKNGEWITQSFNPGMHQLKLDSNMTEIGLSDGNFCLCFQLFIWDMWMGHVVFDLEKCEVSSKENLMSVTYSISEQDGYAYVNGTLFRVKVDYAVIFDDDGVTFDYSNATLKVERFDKSGGSWVELSQVFHSTKVVHLKVSALGDLLHILITSEESEYYLSVYKIFQSEDGEFSGNWDLVNLKFHSPFDSTLGHYSYCIGNSLVEL